MRKDWMRLMVEVISRLQMVKEKGVQHLVDEDEGWQLEKWKLVCLMWTEVW
jgi:hypothetical protein